MRRAARPLAPPRRPELRIRHRLEGAATRWVAGLITAVLLAVVHAWWGGDIGGRSRRPAGQEDVLQGVPRVADGDTLTLEGVRMRLRGLDAPELEQSCEVGGERTPCGRQALAALRDLVADGVVCRGTALDRYDRLLATCAAHGQDVGAALVRAGQAVAFGGYAAEEAEARRAGRGLWAGRFERPADWRRERRQEGAGW